MSADPLEGRERARQEFEQWARENGFSITKANAIDDDVYEDQVTQALHDCWYASAEQERWISVEERLPDMTPAYDGGPKQSERVLVSNGRNVDISRYAETYTKRIARWENKWLNWTHWQELPKAPAPPVHKGDA